MMTERDALIEVFRRIGVSFTDEDPSRIRVSPDTAFVFEANGRFIGVHDAETDETFSDREATS